MEINLGEIKDIEIVKEESQTVFTDKVTLLHIIDNPSAKTLIVILYIEGIQNTLTLWSGQEYDELGDWKHEQVYNRVKELFQ